MKQEEWTIHGLSHRDDGPAIVHYYRSGAPYTEEYYRGGLEHRIDGPSSTTYAKDGKVLAVEYHLYGNEYESLDALYARLAARRGPGLREEFEKSSFAPLLDEGIEPKKIAECLSGGVRTIEGIREVAGGAPIEWVRNYEQASSPDL